MPSDISTTHLTMVILVAVFTGALPGLHWCAARRDGRVTAGAARGATLAVVTALVVLAVLTSPVLGADAFATLAVPTVLGVLLAGGVLITTAWAARRRHRPDAGPA